MLKGVEDNHVGVVESFTPHIDSIMLWHSPELLSCTDHSYGSDPTSLQNASAAHHYIIFRFAEMPLQYLFFLSHVREAVARNDKINRFCTLTCLVPAWPLEDAY